MFILRLYNQVKEVPARKDTRLLGQDSFFY